MYAERMSRDTLILWLSSLLSCQKEFGYNDVTQSHIFRTLSVLKTK